MDINLNFTSDKENAVSLQLYTESDYTHEMRDTEPVPTKADDKYITANGVNMLNENLYFILPKLHSGTSFNPDYFDYDIPFTATERDAKDFVISDEIYANGESYKFELIDGIYYISTSGHYLGTNEEKNVLALYPYIPENKIKLIPTGIKCMYYIMDYDEEYYYQYFFAKGCYSTFGSTKDKNSASMFQFISI